MNYVCDREIQREIDIILNKSLTKSENERKKDYMLIAHLASFNSKDPHSKTGACIISNTGNLISIGWNVMPFEGDFPWGREGNEEDTKYPYVVHAERIAIYNAIMAGRVKDLSGSSIYVNLFPCNQCMQQVVMYDLGALYYDSDKYHDVLFSKEARKIIREFKKNRKEGFEVGQINTTQEILNKYERLRKRSYEKSCC